jgi:spermidine/putrescine transport system permease protein
VQVAALTLGMVLVVLGQFSFVTTIATLVIAVRVSNADHSLNLGATPMEGLP